MARRKQLYYAAYEITEGLYTPGNQLMVFETWENYIGFYHTYNSTDEIYSEPSWDPLKSLVLVPFKNRSTSYFNYVDLKRYKRFNGEKKRLVGVTRQDYFSDPIPVLRKPSEKDLKNGHMSRYFVFKRNEINSKPPVEIGIEQVNTFNSHNAGIDNNLYVFLEISWKLTGPEFDIFDGDILKYPGVYNTNQRIVERNSKKFPILMKTLTNYVQFSMYDYGSM